MTSELSPLEKGVLLAIGYGRNTFTAIDTTANRGGNFRATDRAIQKLRKKGRIKWDGKVWSLVVSKEPPCRRCGGKGQYILAGDAVDCECKDESR